MGGALYQINRFKKIIQNVRPVISPIFSALDRRQRNRKRQVGAGERRPAGSIGIYRQHCLARTIVRRLRRGRFWWTGNDRRFRRGQPARQQQQRQKHRDKDRIFDRVQKIAPYVRSILIDCNTISFTALSCRPRAPLPNLAPISLPSPTLPKTLWF